MFGFNRRKKTREVLPDIPANKLFKPPEAYIGMIGKHRIRTTDEKGENPEEVVMVWHPRMEVWAPIDRTGLMEVPRFQLHSDFYTHLEYIPVTHPTHYETLKAIADSGDVESLHQWLDGTRELTAVDRYTLRRILIAVSHLD